MGGGGSGGATGAACGVGPAIVQSTVITLDGKPVKHWNDILSVLMKGHEGETAHAECTALHRGRTTMVWQTKITREDGEPIYLIPIDEYAYFSATVGSKQQRDQFAGLSRDNQGTPAA